MNDTITTADCLASIRNAVQQYTHVLCSGGPPKLAFDWLQCAEFWLARLRQIRDDHGKDYI